MKPRPLSEAEVAHAYRTYGALLLRRCRVILRNDALADDAFQEAFVKLIRHGARYRDATSKLRWLYRLADRCCFALLKRRKQRSERDAQNRAITLDGPAPPHTSVDVVVRDAAMRILDALDAKDRAIAMMAFVDGMSHRVSGEEGGWARQTIHTRLVRIRKRADQLVGATEGSDP